MLRPPVHGAMPAGAAAASSAGETSDDSDSDSDYILPRRRRRRRRRSRSRTRSRSGRRRRRAASRASSRSRSASRGRSASSRASSRTRSARSGSTGRARSRGVGRAPARAGGGHSSVEARLKGIMKRVMGSAPAAPGLRPQSVSTRSGSGSRSRAGSRGGRRRGGGDGRVRMSRSVLADTVASSARVLNTLVGPTSHSPPDNKAQQGKARSRRTLARTMTSAAAKQRRRVKPSGQKVRMSKTSRL